MSITFTPSCQTGYNSEIRTFTSSSIPRGQKLSDFHILALELSASSSHIIRVKAVAFISGAIHLVQT